MVADRAAGESEGLVGPVGGGVRRWSFVIGLLAVSLAAAPLRAAEGNPSFDCAKARTSDERTICADPRLSELDRVVAGAHELARTRVGAQATQRARELLAERRACGDNKLCIFDQQLRAIGVYRDMGVQASEPDWVVEYRKQLSAAAQRNAKLPQRVGECVMTAITRIGDRFGGDLGPAAKQDFDPGTSVEFANSGYQVSYERESVIARSRVGDKVRMCLVSIPQDCPPGDARGRIYTTTNLRTGEAWTLPDAQHSCGGA